VSGTRRLATILTAVVLLTGIISLYYVWTDHPAHVPTTKNEDNDKMVIKADEIIKAAAEANKIALEKQTVLDQKIASAEEEKKKAQEKQTVLDQEIANAEEEKKKAQEKQTALDQAITNAEEEKRIAQEKQTALDEEKKKVQDKQKTLDEAIANIPHEPEVSRFGVRVATNNGFGVRITDVTKNSAGQEARLQQDDIILTIDGKRVRSLKDFSDAVDASGNRMLVDVYKSDSGKVVEITFVLPEVPGK
jgi:C-terminal processing protease CtpA/Prc